MTPSNRKIIVVVTQKIILCFFIPYEIGRGRICLCPNFIYIILIINCTIYDFPVVHYFIRDSYINNTLINIFIKALRDRNIFYINKLFDTIFRQFPSVSRSFDTAKWSSRVRRHLPIHEHAS